MSKYLPWALLVLIVAGSVYGYTEIRASEEAAKERAARATDRADSLQATNDSLRAAFVKQMREYGAYSARVEGRTDSLRAAVRALRDEADRQGKSATARTDSLQATLESIIVVAENPAADEYARYALTQLDSIRADHRAQVEALESALAAKDSVIRWTRSQLDSAETLLSNCRAGWGQCRVTLDTTRAALGQWREIADPGWLEQLGKCLPETGAKLAVVGGAALADERAGLGAVALFALDMALGGPC